MSKKGMQYETSIKFNITMREKERLLREAKKRGMSMAELLRSWIHKLPPLDDEVDPV
jgi:hypothetical protein